MLKTLAQNVSLHNFRNTTGAYAKCGEIYCQSFEDITIYCTFCEMKLFEFGDFLLHLKNIHFDKNLLKVSQEELQNDNFQLELKNEYTHDDEVNLTDYEWQSCSDNAETVQTEWCKLEIVAEPSQDSYNNSILKTNKKKCRLKLQQPSTTDVDVANKYASIQQEESDSSEIHYNCLQCERTYLNKAALKAHCTREHAVSATLVCSECAMKFPTKRLLSTHLIEAHGGFKCPNCEKRFKYNYMLVNHMPLHTGERSFKCEFENCTKSFFNRRRLTTHLRACHTGCKNYVCETCGYRCYAQNTLKVHVRKHTGERPHACEICDKRFVSHSSLAEHRATHRSDRPYVCDVCGATFARQKALYHHKPLHLGEKKFKCKICGSAYAQAAGLAGHMRKHKEGLF